jgi:hypothetical protein
MNVAGSAAPTALSLGAEDPFGVFSAGVDELASSPAQACGSEGVRAEATVVQAKARKLENWGIPRVLMKTSRLQILGRSISSARTGGALVSSASAE